MTVSLIFNKQRFYSIQCYHAPYVKPIDKLTSLDSITPTEPYMNHMPLIVSAARYLARLGLFPLTRAHHNYACLRLVATLVVETFYRLHD